MSQLNPVGDTELFVVSGEDFSFPIYATPYVYSDPAQELYLVTPALQLMKNPSDMLLSVLLPSCYSRNGDEMEFWFLRGVLLTIAKKAPGITPKYYFKWQNQFDAGRLTATTAEFEEVEDINPSQERFLRYLVNKTAMLDMTQARILWKALMQCGSVWLAKEKKPIDFGLFTVTPLPYRRNWKERVYEMMSERVHGGNPRSFIHAFKTARPQRDKFVDERMPDVFYDTTLMDVDYKEHFCHWCLEMEESLQYKEFAAKVEAEIRHARSRPQYAQKILRAIQARLPAIMDAIGNWITQISRPCGAVEQKRMDCGQSIVPLKKPGQILPDIPRQPSVPVVVNDQPQLTGPTKAEKLAETVKIGLREMHALQLTNGDVRDGGEGHGEPSDKGVAPASGVQLHTCSQGANPGVAVLDEHNNERGD